MVALPSSSRPPASGAADDDAVAGVAAGRAPRQARALATRTAILDAAAHEFAVEGYRAASLSRIHERSGVTKGAMYFHFASKEAMGSAVAERFEARLPEVLAARSADGLDPLTTAVSVSLGFAELVRDEAPCRAGLRVVTDRALGPERARWPYEFWEGTHADLLGRAQRDGSLRAEVDTAELARTVVATCVGHWAISAAFTGLADVRERTAASWTVLLSTAADPAWLEQRHTAGGFSALPGGT
ncbi:TetR/AcrR family transcriptional regulator [Actinomycetospora endophytica]|uniref:TetR/AcrR family transcriptional regulator n=1 Tax=Actinomycetospora endophytica TaxID=2291215 RepID=A0ABS8P3C7_9PSEU|nr:ScbR family autoregulator-binding transcription factor [Actinomycetospora endophytica]MCD2192738.1 TetR/AcrR family transcriptional regulator [Actinomycetospora endophytica]